MRRQLTSYFLASHENPADRSTFVGRRLTAVSSGFISLADQQLPASIRLLARHSGRLIAESNRHRIASIIDFLGPASRRPFVRRTKIITIKRVRLNCWANAVLFIIKRFAWSVIRRFMRWNSFSCDHFCFAVYLPFYTSIAYAFCQ